MRHKLGLFTVLFFSLAPIAVAEDQLSTQAAALQALKAAIEKGDVKALAQNAAGEPGVILRRLADPFAKAKTASDRLDKALMEKAEIGWRNPFSSGLTPLTGARLEIVEIGKEGSDFVARVRFGQADQEESLGIRNESGSWRVDLPAELVRALRPLGKPERLDRRRTELEQLTDVLNSLAADIESGKRKTKEAVMLRLLELIGESNLFPPPPESTPDRKTNASG
jgi:hypothetical protein